MLYGIIVLIFVIAGITMLAESLLPEGRKDWCVSVFSVGMIVAGAIFCYLIFSLLWAFDPTFFWIAFICFLPFMVAYVKFFIGG